MMKPVGIEEHGALERQEDVDHLMREAISMHSEAISMHSEAISMHSSDRRMPITCDQPALIHGHPWSSLAIRGHKWQSVAIRRTLASEPKSTFAVGSSQHKT
jgi:hypothetical protein